MTHTSRLLCTLLVCTVTSVTHGQATHNLRSEGFDFGGGAAVNPNNGWTFADGGVNPLTNFVNNWNEPDFGAGQPGWEGPTGAPFAGWAPITEDSVFFSGHDLETGEIVTHGGSNVLYTPSDLHGDPLGTENDQFSVSIDGTIHHTRQFDRSGPWILLRNNTDILARGFITDDTLGFNSGPLSLAANASDPNTQDGFINADQVTVVNDQLTGISYNPGDFFNLLIGTGDFAAVDMNVQSFTDPGNGFGEPPPPLPKTAYYRFEEASGVDIMDSISNEKHGEFVSVPLGNERSTDVPVSIIPQTGEANTTSADLRQGGSILMEGSDFVFNGPSAGGADGDATLEWYMKVPNDSSPDIAGPNGHTSIFWTNASGVNSNRYNVFWDASFVGSPDSERFIAGDFANQAAEFANIGNFDNGNPLTEDEWHHIAIVRTDNTPEDDEDFDFTWEWYIDGVLSPDHTIDSPLATPALDLFGWTIAGRPGSPFYALFDEVRMSNEALSPSQFLNSLPVVGVPGDYNNDGVVNAADYGEWIANLGGTNLDNRDPNLTGPIGVADYLFWKSQLGNGSGVGSGDAVPEPSTVLLIVVGSLLAVNYRRSLR